MQRSGWLMLGLTVVLAGCAPAPPPPPPDTRAADIQAVKDVEAAWLKDVSSKDIDKFVSYFAEDGSGLYPGMPILNGKAEIKKSMGPMMTDPNFSLTFASSRVEAAKGGDMVYTQGEYTLTVTDPKTKKPVTDKGKYITVFRKQADGTWKVVADIINSNTAM